MKVMTIANTNINELVQVENEQVVTDSRKVGEVFDKPHKTVLRSIENIIAEAENGLSDNSAQNCAQSFFYETTYKDGSGKSNKMYLMNRDGFSLLVMGFTGAKAMQWKIRYIEAFNEMEKRLKEQSSDSYMIADPVARALKWAEEQKAHRQQVALLEANNARQEQIIGELKPKADYTDMILQNKGLVPITAIAKDYGMSGVAMNEKLHEMKIIYKMGRQWLLYSKYQAKGYTHSETVNFKHKDGRDDVAMNTKWTQKGRLFLYEKLKEQGILPVIERTA
jgi:Rha family phage regulatory protein